MKPTRSMIVASIFALPACGGLLLLLVGGGAPQNGAEDLEPLEAAATPTPRVMATFSTVTLGLPPSPGARWEYTDSVNETSECTSRSLLVTRPGARESASLSRSIVGA